MKLIVFWVVSLLSVVSAFAADGPAGIGVALGVEGSNIIVKAIVPDSPASASSAIHVGDTILAVAQDKGTPVEVHSGDLAQVPTLVKGPKGTVVRLTMVPKGAAISEARVVPLVRGELAIMVGKPLAEGSRAPEISMIRLPDGKSQQLKDFAGKVVVIDFWATWCGPCQTAMAELQTYPVTHPEWKDKVVFIAASTDENKELPIQRLNAKGWHQTHNVWVGAEASLLYHVEFIPMTYVLDPEGKILAVNPREKLLEVISAYLAKKG